MYQNVASHLEDFVVLFDFWKAGDATELETQEAFQKATLFIEEAEFKSTLNKPEDELPAILQINPGAGSAARRACGTTDGRAGHPAPLLRQFRIFRRSPAA